MRIDWPILSLALGETLIWAAIYYIFPALLLQWEADLGWPRTALTGAITLALFLSALSAPVAGRIIDRGHGPALMAGSALMGGIGLLLLSRVSAFWQFYAIWALIGMAMAGSLYEPCFAIVTRARGAAARQAITMITLVAGFAGTLSFPGAHYLAAELGWRGAVLVAAGVVLALAAPLLWAGARALERAGADRPVRASPPPAGRRTLLRAPVFWLLATGFATLAILHGVTIQHLLPILDSRGVAPETAVLAASFIGPMQVAGRLAMVAAGRSASSHAIALVCFGCAGLAVAILWLAGAAPVLLGLFVLMFGGAYGMVSILRPVITREILGAEGFGAKSGSVALFYLIGSASAPWLGAVVWRAGGYDVVLAGLVALAAVGSGLYVAARRMAGSDQGF